MNKNLLLFLVMTMSIIACQPAAESPTSQLTFYVLNANESHPSVNIKVALDTMLMVNEEFTMIKEGHNWEDFNREIRKGIYNLSISSETVTDQRDTTLTLDQDEYYFLIEYHDAPGREDQLFYLHISTQPIYFM